jgi:ribosomal protein S18 acetylase RimI-like enzyme
MGDAGLDLTRRIAETYRWHRRLGARVIETSCCCIVADPVHPGVWESNHVESVIAETDHEIDAVFAAMEVELAHTNWRVAHTDGFTPDAFLARLAFADYQQRFVAIQMALGGPVRVAPTPLDLRPVESDDDWRRLAALVRLNHVEGHATGGLLLPPEFTADMVAVYRAKAPRCRFYLVHSGDEAIAYGASMAAPNGIGMIEDVFTRAEHRRRGVASAMLAAFAADLTARGCDCVFLGALADEQAKRLYAQLGFRPVGLVSTWVKDTLKSAR